MIRPMNMLPVAGDFTLQQLDSMIIPCQPEPPWIKRCSFGIKFTDEIQATEGFDFVQGESEEEGRNGEKKKKRKKDKDSDDDEGEEDNRNLHEGEESAAHESERAQNVPCKANSTGKIMAKMSL